MEIPQRIVNFFPDRGDKVPDAGAVAPSVPPGVNPVGKSSVHHEYDRSSKRVNLFWFFPGGVLCKIVFC